MKCLAYEKAHALADFSLQLRDVPAPKLRGRDLLVQVHAVSINPVDYKIRASRNGTSTEPVILGWDAAGEVVETGPEAGNFRAGDKVFFAGDLTRAGSYAELAAVDERIVAKMPSGWSWEDAASLPLTSLTAWELLFEKIYLQRWKMPSVLILGGAGGVGSIAIQLLKAQTGARVIATASRPETRQWCRTMGADVVIDHSKALKPQLEAEGVPEVEVIFGTTHTKDFLSEIPGLLKPFGHLGLIDDADVFDANSFKTKALSIHFELMFTKSMFGFDMDSQNDILRNVASLAESGRIKSTRNLTLRGLTPETFRQAHEIQESGKAIGKTVVLF